MNEPIKSNPTCPYCSTQAALVTGQHVYPHRPDLFGLKFWACTPCDAYVGCHKEGAWMKINGMKVVSDGTLPLGRLANAELRQAKQAAHAAFDPLWKAQGMTRRDAYSWLARQLGIRFDDCHIGMFDVDQCNNVVSLSLELAA
jgi:hypothetical protein